MILCFPPKFVPSVPPTSTSAISLTSAPSCLSLHIHTVVPKEDHMPVGMTAENPECSGGLSLCN